MVLNDVFKDLKVIEIASVLAGPAVGMFFAELGAKVIKVENKKTNGDITRSWKLPCEKNDVNYSAYYHSTNWNKEVIFLDFKNTADYSKIIELIRNADIVISNFKIGSDVKLKLDYETLKNINPKLIYAQVTAYGLEDKRPGFDARLQAETGWMSMNGDPNSKPTKVPLAIIDLFTAHQIKEGVLIALIQRMKNGKGSKVTASLFDSSICSLANQASNWLNASHNPRRIGSQHPNIAPYGDLFLTKDEKYIMLAIGNDKQFYSFCKLLDINCASEFNTNTTRVNNREKLNELIQEKIAFWYSMELINKCDANSIPISIVKDLENVFNSEKAKKLVLSQIEEDGTISKRVKTVSFNIVS